MAQTGVVGIVHRAPGKSFNPISVSAMIGDRQNQYIPKSFIRLV
jgi:hypothetical protein